MDTAYITSKGQLVVPAKLRRRYGIKPGTKICFIERGHEILFQPVTKEYIHSICGMLKSHTSITQELLKERSKDKQIEDKKSAKPGSR